jgi:phage/plasmid primase-like uncharacterized protein
MLASEPQLLAGDVLHLVASNDVFARQLEKGSIVIGIYADKWAGRGVKIEVATASEPATAPDESGTVNSNLNGHPPPGDYELADSVNGACAQKEPEADERPHDDKVQNRNGYRGDEKAARWDVVAEFRKAMVVGGVDPGEQAIIQDGRIHRFRGPGDKVGRKNCWYVRFEHGGAFGSHRLGLTEKWSERDGYIGLSPEERRALAEKIKRDQTAAEAELKRRQVKAAQNARQQWEQAGPIQSREQHRYLVRKQIDPHCARTLDGKLVIAMFDADGALVNLQTIESDGEKLFLYGGRVAGCFSLIGETAQPQQIAICEGFATAATIHQAAGIPAVVAFNAGNLLGVAKGVKQKYPKAAILICGDDDAFGERNIGREKAQAAARATNSQTIFPEFPDSNESGTDFNDLAAAAGIDTVRQQIAQALEAVMKDEDQAGFDGDQKALIPAIIVEDYERALVTNREYLAREPVIERLGYTCSAGLLLGGKHHGKTTVMRTIALSVALGVPFFGRAVKQGHVVYAAAEDEYETTRMELLRMGWDSCRDQLSLVKFNPENAKADPDQVLDEIADLALKKGAVLICLDMLFDFAGIKDEMGYAHTKEATGRIVRLATLTKTFVLASHHSPKWIIDAATAAQSALGSQGVVARFSPAILVKMLCEKELYTIESSAVRDPRGELLKQTCLELDECGWAMAGQPFQDWMRWVVHRQRIIDLFTCEEPGARLTVIKVAQQLNIGRPQAQNALKHMYEAGVLGREKPNRSHAYFVPLGELYDRIYGPSKQNEL